MSKKPAQKKSSDPLDTPVMRQYLELKELHPDAILFFRMGDFYEMFLEDAQKAAKLIDVALTARQNSIPMAGVPYHSADTYIARLIGAGCRVAIAEQEVDPHNPKLMRRAVKRVITPGTLIEESLLQNHFHNYLLALIEDDERLGIACADVSTGDFFTFEITIQAESENERREKIRQELRDLFVKYSPRELLLPTELMSEYRTLLPDLNLSFTPLEPWKGSALEGVRQIKRLYGADPRGLGYEDESIALGAASLVLHYVAATLPDGKTILAPPTHRSAGGEIMNLDEQTIRNLDLVYNYQERDEERTLFGVLNRCRTAGGRRRLRDLILTPLTSRAKLEERQAIVEYLVNNEASRNRINTALEQVYDLERISGRLNSGRGLPRDFIAIKKTCQAAAELRDYLQGEAPPVQLKALFEPDSALAKFVEDIVREISPEPAAVPGKSPFLNQGINPELDRFRESQENGSRWIVEFETGERERTGISNLRVRYNRVVGYFIEVSRAQVGNVPPEYERRQTLVGNERFSCEKLKELESVILQADEAIEQIESAAFRSFVERVEKLQPALKKLAGELSAIDTYYSLALTAVNFNWSRPHLTEDGQLLIEDGRHPVVEAFLPPAESFVANSVKMDSYERSFSILTGPNMAGKSTYIRQIAIIQLLAQIGSFVPARHATLSVADRIFTRIGAADNLSRGESTFYVEMLETARIINQATERSLVIMDEVGRGTSTYDGLSIAWAVVEHFSNDDPVRPRVLFATHYHELTALESRPGVFNLTMDVRESENRVIFLHQVREGKADESYGIHVATLAGLPPELTERAREKLTELEAEYQKQKAAPPRKVARRKEKPPAAEQELLF